MVTKTRATTFDTGVAGFIGSALFKLLVGRRHRVFGLVDSMEAAGRVRRGKAPAVGPTLDQGLQQVLKSHQ